ncbi:MAG: hypothetical protein CM1200mP13_15870 [Candidatus Pelagibacterales bacterium]|nr:MAG: hypothetical protein CM1200mP13_15870 [Pelagibacterales bacterium]
MNLNNKNHYTYIDNKTVPIVFIHGVGLDRNMWSPQINYLKNPLYTNIRSPWTWKDSIQKRKFKIKDYVNQLLSLSEFLNLDKFHLVGF